MKTTENPSMKKRRITIEVDGRLSALLESAKENTGLGLPELGRMALIKVVRELKQTGRIVADAMPEPDEALTA